MESSGLLYNVYGKHIRQIGIVRGFLYTLGTQLTIWTEFTGGRAKRWKIVDDCGPSFILQIIVGWNHSYDICGFTM